jgi:hypothetical protein
MGLPANSTKLQRRQQLMSSYGAVADIACCTAGKTRDLLSVLTEHLKKLTLEAEPAHDEAASTLASMNTAQPNLLTANPPTKQNQKQNRIEPSAPGPTTKGFKKVQRKNERAQKDSATVKLNKSLGRTASVKDSYH